jgi:hypothetical protein
MGALFLWWHISVSPLLRLIVIQALTDFTRYVAMHSMTEATNPQEEPVINGYLDAPLGKQTMSKTDILIVIFGMLLPLVTQIGHAHAHAH